MVNNQFADLRRLFQRRLDDSFFRRRPLLSVTSHFRMDKIKRVSGHWKWQRAVQNGFGLRDTGRNKDGRTTRFHFVWQPRFDAGTLPEYG